MDLRRIFRRKPAPVARFGEIPAVAAELPRWLRRARRLSSARVVTEAQPFLVDAEHATADDFAALARRLNRALTMPERLRTVPVEARVAAWLAAAGRREELADFVVERHRSGDQFATRVVEGRVFADFEQLQPDGIPADLLEVEPRLSDLELRIRRCRVVDGGVELELFAVVPAVDYVTTPPSFTVTRDGADVPFEQADDPAASRFSARRHQCHDGGALRLRLPDPERDLHVTVRAGGFRRTAVLAAGRIRARMPRPARAGQVTDVVVTDETVDLVGGGVEVPLWVERPFRGPGPRPSGPVELPSLEPGPELSGRLPLEVLTAHHRVEVTAVEGRLRLHVAPPLTDAERGPYRQTRLQAQHGREPIDEQMALFSTYAGTSVTDSPLAIQQELGRRQPELRVLWAVADHSVDVPEGTEPVVVRSREWYDAWSRAHLVVTNVEPDRWYRPRAGQQLVQTFHGYPSKTMGRVLWESKNFSPRRIRHQLEHTSGTWSLLVTPAEIVDRHYREQYDWTGPIVHEGYPRNDTLVGTPARERRRQVREALGIGDRIAVLHAPTWRDDLASNFRAAEALETLDIEEFARSLPDHVLLMRGHRFHAAGGDRPGVIDVTDHPEINDLILAADVAVLDYSSLRFDFALTGKPMVFLVPDLAAYTHGSRGFLYPFEETAPGPLVATTADVVQHVRDPAMLARERSEELAAFNARFNAKHDGRAARRVVDVILGLISPDETSEASS